MQAETRILVEIEDMLMDDEVRCPLCDSHYVEETSICFECCTCGTAWKTISIER